MMVRRMARKIREPHFCALDPSGDQLDRVGVRLRGVCIILDRVPRGFRHPADQGFEVVCSGSLFGRGRGLARQPIRQDLTHPILEAKAGLARGGFRSAAGLRVKVIELREDGSSHGRACGCRISGRQRAPGSRCCRVGRVPWPGKRRAGINEPTIHLRRSVVKKPLRPRGSPIWRSKDEPSFVPFGHPERKAFFAPA